MMLRSRFSDLKSLEAGVGFKIWVGFKIESCHSGISVVQKKETSVWPRFLKKILKPKTQDRLILNS